MAFIVIYDANVLYGNTLRDLLLRHRARTAPPAIGFASGGGSGKARPS
jgi:hypothetical protein